jgi:2-polyprenyl-3-methyl-5-hydroxy-6-metoxy-1,4-benzoquinol methylase
MNINYEYFLHYVKKKENYKNIKVLDFGCGKGEILQLLLDNGINAYGVDIYHQGPSEEVLSSELYKQGKIKIIEINKKLPFEDKSFDLIISNQVFEHVSNIDFVSDELSRLLKDRGKMYHHFPSKEVWREGHIGILFSHWFSSEGKLRYLYTFLMRLVGFGRNKKGKTISEWTKHNINYLDKFCYYRKNSELNNILRDYEIENKEIDYIKFRGINAPIIKNLVKLGIFRKAYESIFRKLAFMAIELRKK